MPHCILVLRLIGIVYDLYDGHQPQETLSASNKLVALVRRPTILEIYGHTLFPAAFLVGPQFPMKRYLDFVTRVYSNPVSVKKGLFVTILIIQIVGDARKGTRLHRISS